MKRRPPTITCTRTLAKTRIFHIEQLGLRFANGVEVEYERLVSNPNGAVLVVPMLDKDTVLLIREYAAGVDRYELALPKGRLEDNESIIEGANREIREEVGYGARQLTHLTALTLAPGYLNHATQIVLAEDLFEDRAQGDEPEEIDVIPWKLSELHHLLQHEECTEARSIAALFMVREHLNARTA